MENNELQRIWKNIDNEIPYKSSTELNLLLSSKARQTLNRYLAIVGVSVITSIGMLIWLTITSLNRQYDTIYLLNNITLSIVTILALISGLYTWHLLQRKNLHQPLKDWLESRIKLLSKWLTGKSSKLYLYILPLIYILMVLSIHVYYENKLFTEVLRTEESVFGLIISIPIGLVVAYFSIRKIRKFQLNNLEFLKDLYNRLCRMD